MFRVMLVEDDQRLADLVIEYLNSYEFSVDLVTRGDQALAFFQEKSPDLVILDLMLPGSDGMAVCRQIRAISQVPILILTAREDSYDEVSALEQGADDFVTKPVQPRILLARLRSLARRLSSPNAIVENDISNANSNLNINAAANQNTNTHGNTNITQLTFGNLQIVLSDRMVFWQNQVVDLTNTEFKLLIVLAESAGKVLSRDDILMRLRGITFDGLDRSIDNLISRLRRRLDDEKAEKIKTVWGEGYLFSPSAWG